LRIIHLAYVQRYTGGEECRSKRRIKGSVESDETLVIHMNFRLKTPERDVFLKTRHDREGARARRSRGE